MLESRAFSLCARLLTRVATLTIYSCRGGFCTLPTTAAFLGGVVAQEAIKLVTSQYVPLNNTVIVDLIKGGIRKYTL